MKFKRNKYKKNKLNAIYIKIIRKKDIMNAKKVIATPHSTGRTRRIMQHLRPSTLIRVSTAAANGIISLFKPSCLEAIPNETIVIETPTNKDQGTQTNPVESVSTLSKLEALPSELLIQIVQNLSLSDLKQVALTSRTLHCIAQPNINLLKSLLKQLQIEHNLRRTFLRLKPLKPHLSNFHIHISIEISNKQDNLMPERLFTYIDVRPTIIDHETIIRADESSRYLGNKDGYLPFIRNTPEDNTKDIQLLLRHKRKDISTMTAPQIPTQNLPTNTPPIVCLWETQVTKSRLEHPDMLTLLRKLLS